MYEWMRKIHMYAGLLTFTALLVWGFTGIHAVFLPSPGNWPVPADTGERNVAFEAPGDLDDEQLAKRIFEAAAIPMAGGFYNTHRDDDHHLAFLAYTANGQREVTYLEEQQQIRVRIRQNSLGSFLSGMHAAHSRRGPPDLSARLWAFYNEFSTWAFFFLSLSGGYMWLATRPGLPWAQMCIGGATAVFVILWWVTR